MPGTDIAEAVATVAGEVGFPFVPELPARGLGADMIGRTAAVLVDLPVDEVPSGYRVTARAGRVHRRAVDLLRWDLDAVTEGFAGAEVVKVQVAGPWTVTSGIELASGHRVLTDGGALKEFTESLVEGVIGHAAEVHARTGARVVVQLDEPGLPAVLDGAMPTASGYGTVPAVAEPDARRVLASVIGPVAAATGAPVIVHCCARRPPIRLLRDAGAGGLSFDATVIGRRQYDELGEAWDAGTMMLLGLVPAIEPASMPTLRSVADPALQLVDRLGFDRTLLRRRAIPTPTCGLAGASTAWTRRALRLTGEAAKAFAEPPESWNH